MVNLPTAGVDYHVPFGGRKGSTTARVSRGATPPSSTRWSRPPTNSLAKATYNGRGRFLGNRLHCEVAGDTVQLDPSISR